MPIYEFFCPDNHKIYTFLARNLAYSAVQPRCPDDPRFRMERMISGFSVTGRAKEAPDPGAAAIDDPGFDSAMAAMEREFDTLDSDRPDPRQVARMLRTMTTISGESIPEQMEEVMRRLEAGEALDKLDEEFGEGNEVLDAEPHDAEDVAGSGELQRIKERLRSARQRPVRDPVMYEMADYADLPPTSTPGNARRSRRGRTR